MPGIFGSLEVEADPVLGKELFDLWEGFYTIAMPCNWVEDNFIGFGHAAIISAVRNKDKIFSCLCSQTVVNLGIHSPKGTILEE
jgi:hypothetical protein